MLILSWVWEHPVAAILGGMFGVGACLEILDIVLQLVGQETWRDRILMLAVLATSAIILAAAIFASRWMALRVGSLDWHHLASTVQNKHYAYFFPFAALFMFWCRGRLPKSYGFAEFVAGLVAMWYGVTAQPAGVAPELLVLSALGGMYVMVRGMDTFERGLPKTANVGKVWFGIFPRMRGKESRA